MPHENSNKTKSLLLTLMIKTTYYIVFQVSPISHFSQVHSRPLDLHQCFTLNKTRSLRPTLKKKYHKLSFKGKPHISLFLSLRSWQLHWCMHLTPPGQPKQNQVTVTYLAEKNHIFIFEVSPIFCFIQVDYFKISIRTSPYHSRTPHKNQIKQLNQSNPISCFVQGPDLFNTPHPHPLQYTEFNILGHPHKTRSL